MGGVLQTKLGKQKDEGGEKISLIIAVYQDYLYIPSPPAPSLDLYICVPFGCS